MMQAVEEQFGTNGKPPITIECLTNNFSCYSATEARSSTKKVLGKKSVKTPVPIGMAGSLMKTRKRELRQVDKQNRYPNCDGPTERLI